MKLEAVASLDGDTVLWQACGQVRLPGGALPARMTILREGEGEGLILVSPLALDDADAAQLAKLGEVTHIVAPNLEHHLFLAGAVARYPHARVLAPPGFAAKHGESGGIRVDAELPEAALPGCRSFLLDGAPPMNEVVIYHEATQTLIVTDLLFNLPTPEGWVLWLITKLAGTSGKLAFSRLWGLWVKDWSAFGHSVAAVLELPFERAVMAHGAPVLEAAHARVSAALAKPSARAR